MIRRPPRSTLSSSSAASDVYKRQRHECYCSVAPGPRLGPGAFGADPSAGALGLVAGLPGTTDGRRPHAPGTGRSARLLQGDVAVLLRDGGIGALVAERPQ